MSRNLPHRFEEPNARPLRNRRRAVWLSSASVVAVLAVLVIGSSILGGSGGTSSGPGLLAGMMQMLGFGQGSQSMPAPTPLSVIKQQTERAQSPSASGTAVALPSAPNETT